LGDQNKFLPTVHGFDEFLGNLYHLNAEEDPEDPDYPKDPKFKEQFGRAECCTASRPTRTIGRSRHVGVG
jgi:arylsulfatase A-like enzyme